MKTPLAVCLLGMLATTLPMTVSTQDMDVTDFVRATYIEGIPYDLANAYTSDVVPVLLDMLQDEEQTPYWGNIAVTLCIIGDERTVEPLIEFIEGNVEGEITDALYEAKSSAILALGYLVNKSGNGRSLQYLIVSAVPDTWGQRGIEWQAPYQASRDERNVDLSTAAILGLALSGRDDAKSALRDLPLRDDQAGLIDAALETLDAVAEGGLSGYYRDSRARLRR